MPKTDVIVLFSGGLDSILAARLLQEQGLGVRCLHFVSPFFGNAGALERWRADYGLQEIDSVDVGEEFSALVADGPPHGFGKVLNPCVDCKILLLKRAFGYMKEAGASFLASGEVIGQRPMSQRRDTLNLIQREAGVGGLLLRPLCAQHLEPTRPELDGLVRRESLPGLSGRGRSGQLALAGKFGLKNIPTPAGGCLLTEKENARSFWPLICRQPAGRSAPRPGAGDFRLAARGRQFWATGPGDAAFWLVVGRNQEDNLALAALAREEDATLKVCRLPGPIALARGGAAWPDGMLLAAASLCASYSPRAVAAGGMCSVRVATPAGARELAVTPTREGPWQNPDWQSAHEALCATRRARAAEAG